MQYLKALILRPHLMFSIVCGVLAYFILPQITSISETARIILSWDGLIGIYLLLAFKMMFRSNHTSIANRALAQVEGQGFILLLSVGATSMSFFTIVMELATIKQISASLRTGPILIVVATILLSWFFIHVIFALHYAHSYYERVSYKKSAGLTFPSSEMPDYFDFIYFSFVIGTSGQTADVSFSSREMRRTGTVHCVLSYFFNATILALGINIASSLV